MAEVATEVPTMEMWPRGVEDVPYSHPPVREAALVARYPRSIQYLSGLLKTTTGKMLRRELRGANS